MTTTEPISERKVPTRRISFDDEALANLPKHYAGNADVIASHLIASLSAVFPDGEDFFVRSVRNYRDQIDDPELKRQVAGFIGQEAMHGREHRALNDRLSVLGYATKRVEALTKWGLETRERLLPPISNLAATAALEHFTATFAEVLLSSEEAREQVGDTVVRDILLWHALEESEHKAVAFDVYKAVGGSERLREGSLLCAALRLLRLPGAGRPQAGLAGGRSRCTGGTGERRHRLRRRTHRASALLASGGLRHRQ